MSLRLRVLLFLAVLLVLAALPLANLVSVAIGSAAYLVLVFPELRR